MSKSKKSSSEIRLILPRDLMNDYKLAAVLSDMRLGPFIIERLREHAPDPLGMRGPAKM